MPKADIPPAVLQFILKRIDTVTELETLLIMCADEARVWSVDDIASRIYVPAPGAAAVLHGISVKGLVSVDESGREYRFSPANDEVRQMVQQTAAAYRKNLIPITTLIHNKASVSVQEFARAFSLKKDD
jgi:hypothetical protein